MKESFGNSIELVPNYPSEGRLLMDDLLEQMGLSRQEFHRLPDGEREEVTAQIKELFQSPEVQNILANREADGLQAGDAQLVRDSMGIDKWNKLSEIVSYVKTLLGDKTQEERKNIFAKHLAFGVDVNEIQHTLTGIHDVMPARLDTDIRHQSSLFYRAVVEIASNALDASILHRSPIGRFGVGFYQILNHLKDPSDKVVVRTRIADSKVGAKVEFKNKKGEIVIQITEDDSIDGHGTTVELSSKEFESAKAEDILREYFSHTQDAELVINGAKLDRWKPTGGAEVPSDVPVIDIKIEDGKCIIADKGIGMEPRVIFEKLLVPKLSDKPPVYELKEGGKVPPRIYYEKDPQNGVHKSRIFIQVGGIVIETAETSGTFIADTLVIDLPPSTILGEQRDQVEVNRDTVDALKNAVDQVVTFPRPECFEVINSLGKVCRTFQNRSKLYERGDNIYVYLQDKVRDTFPDVNFLPNRAEFFELDLNLNENNVAYLDKEIYQSPIDRVSGLDRVTRWSSRGNIPLFEAKFKKESTLGIIKTDGYLIIDKRAHAGENPAIVNKAIELAAGHGKGSIQESVLSEPAREEREMKKFEDLEDLVREQWESFSFTSQDVALRQAQTYKEKNPEVSVAFTKNILSKLHTAAAVEAWDILHWYICGDTRDVAAKLAEIEQLAKNIDALMGDHELAQILKTNRTPIISMFETYGPNIPQHFKDNQYKLETSVIVDGKKYHCLKDYRTDSLRYATVEGEFVDVKGSGDVVYRDSLITVHKDRIVNTLDGKVLKLDLPYETPWGTIVLSENREGKKEFKLDKAEFLSDRKENDNTGEGEPRRWKVDNTFSKTLDKVVLLNERKVASLNTLVENSAIAEEYKKFIHIYDVLETESGDPIFVLNNLERYYRNDCFSINNERYPDTPELFCVLDKDGKVVWKFDPVQWQDKIVIDEKYEYGRSHDYGVKMTNESNAQCFPVSYDRPVSADDPIVKIVKYYFINSSRYLENVAYVSANGKVTHVSDMNDINATTLGIKYSTESSCPCCGVYGHNGFEKGNYGDPFSEDSDQSLIKSRTRIPVIITGEFSYDSVNEQWVAEAMASDDTDRGTLYTAIFDKHGNFLRAETEGLVRGSITGIDNRQQKKHLQYRLPERLKKINAKDLDYSSYDQQIGKFFTVRDQAIIRKRSGDHNYDPELQEADNTARNLFDVRKGELSPEHINVLKKYLLKYPILDREKVERIVYRALEYRNLSQNDFELLLPLFYESDYIPPNFFNDRMIQSFRRVSYLDIDRFTRLFEMVEGCIPDSEEKGHIVAEKIIKFYSEKLQGESVEESIRLLSSLAEVKEYSNTVKCDGFTLIKSNVSVPASEVPRVLRPFLTFIQRDDNELAYKGIETIKVPEIPSQTIRLSEIIQWKRLRESEARDYSGTDNLEETVHKVTHGKSREHILREITHAVHFQALNSTDLYVRELIQNAVDVMQSTDMKKSDRNIEITVSANDEKELTTAFHDPVGMDIHTVLNYFLVPGESTKLDRNKGFIGFYGQGVYTLFKNFKELNIKTSIGDGTVWYLTIKPIIEHDMVNDVSINFRPVSEDFKGTTISKTQAAENPYIEAAYVKDAVMTLTSALTDDRASILYQNEKINSKYKVLSSKRAGNLGRVTIYKNPNNIVTQYGLYVKDISEEYTGLLPDFMTQSLRRWGGIAIDLPVGAELTRSRQDIANKDKVSEILNPEIQSGLVEAYIKGFKEKMKSGETEFPFEQLPYDYFSEGEKYELPSSYREDADALFNGRVLKHVDEYVESQSAVRFMTLLPVFKVKDQTISLDMVRQAFVLKKKTFPFDQEDWEDMLPYKLVSLLRKQKDQRQERHAREVEAKKDAIYDATLDDVIKQSKGELKKWMEENKGNLELVDKLTQEFLSAVNKPFDKTAKGQFHYSRTGETAHARRGGDLSWNLYSMMTNDWRSAIKDIKKFKGEVKDEDGNKVENLTNTLGVLAHEYGHVIESLSAWTHDLEHDMGQARVLIQFLAQNGPDRVLSVLRGEIKENK